jgi:hypothetical protein
MLLSFMLLGCFPLLFAQTVKLENEQTEMRISLSGGVIKEMNLKEVDVKPIHAYGHFVCFDRWGPSSPEDQALGIPWHGEGSKVSWELDQEPVPLKGGLMTEMSGYLPIVKMGIRRKIYLDGTSPVFLVQEELTNHNAGPKVYNLVQHPTIGTPFLGENTIVDTRVDSGYSQAGALPPEPEDVLHWPEDTVDGDWTDMRYLTSDHSWWGAVLSFPLDTVQSYSWVTAVNPDLQLMLGYLWPTEEYPWMNLWMNLKDEAPFARGLEFGTTGLHQAWPELLDMQEIFGRTLSEELEAGESSQKTYYAFLCRVPGDYQGVSDVLLEDSTIRIEEYGADAERTIRLDIGGIFEAMNDTVSSTAVPSVGQSPQVRIYPNPFTESARITYRIPEAARVVARVYDLSGQQVAEVENQWREAGEYTADFQPVNLPGSLYILHLTAGESQRMMKLMHVK